MAALLIPPKRGEADDAVFNVNGGLYSLPLGEG